MPRFVVQKHRSRTLHYDLRLEIDGVLKSWALPKGPSLNPKDSRLAVEVDEHALTYFHFEGEIPEGHYGAGEVIIWDRGEYISDISISKQYKNGDIEVELIGKKLKGKFKLLKMKKWSGKTEKWILKKIYDKYISYDDVTATHPGSVVSLRRLK